MEIGRGVGDAAQGGHVEGFEVGRVPGAQGVARVGGERLRGKVGADRGRVDRGAVEVNLGGGKIDNWLGAGSVRVEAQSVPGEVDAGEVGEGADLGEKRAERDADVEKAVVVLVGTDGGRNEGAIGELGERDRAVGGELGVEDFGERWIEDGGAGGAAVTRLAGLREEGFSGGLVAVRRETRPKVDGGAEGLLEGGKVLEDGARGAWVISLCTRSAPSAWSSSVGARPSSW